MSTGRLSVVLRSIYRTPSNTGSAKTSVLNLETLQDFQRHEKGAAANIYIHPTWPRFTKPFRRSEQQNRWLSRLVRPWPYIVELFIQRQRRTSITQFGMCAAQPVLDGSTVTVLVFVLPHLLMHVGETYAARLTPIHTGSLTQKIVAHNPEAGL